MKNLYCLLENNATVEFLNRDIVHVSFNESGLLSTQLMRELKVLSKIKTGTCPKAYILTVHDYIDIEKFFWRICRKAERYAPGTMIAVICKSYGSMVVARNYLYIHKPMNPFKVFDNYEDGEQWIAKSLMLTNEPQLIPTMEETLSLSA